MSLRSLSEAIILQSAEDFLGASHKGEGSEFFSGDGFRICAEMAGMNHDDQLTFLNMLVRCVSESKTRSGEPVEKKKISGNGVHPHRGRKNAVMNAL